MSIDFERFKRLLSRCGEVAGAATAKPVVKTVYDGRLAALSTEYLAAHDALPLAEGAQAKEGREALLHLAALDQPYREARAVYLAFFPDAVLPETLKLRRTDTDKKLAISTLLDRLDDHVGQPWADQVLAGPFGQTAAQVMQELDEAVTANTALGAARLRRASAYGPAYEAYLAFKNVVRNAYGPKSREYRRIHLRADGTFAQDENEGDDTDDTDGTDGTDGTGGPAGPAPSPS